MQDFYRVPGSGDFIAEYRLDAYKYAVSQGCSEETSFFLLSLFVDAFIPIFEREHGPISSRRKTRKPARDSDVHSLEPEPGTDETTSCAARDEHVAVSGTCIPLTHIAEEVDLSVVAGLAPRQSSQPGTDVSEEKRLKRKRKHDSHKHECHTAPKKARLEVDLNNNNNSSDSPAEENLNNNCSRLDAPLTHDSNNNTSRGQDAPVTQDCNNDYTPVAQDSNNNNNYSSLDARLEQFFMCPKTNRLIPKAHHTHHSTETSSGHFSEKPKHKSEKAKSSHKKDQRRRFEDKPKQQKPRLRTHRRERSLLKEATIRCLVRKALETGTYCCYKRCLLARPRLYV